MAAAAAAAAAALLLLSPRLAVVAAPRQCMHWGRSPPHPASSHCFPSRRGVLPRQVGAFGEPGRDPRGWTITVAFAALVPSTQLGVKAADDAQVWLEGKGVDGKGRTRVGLWCKQRGKVAGG